MSRPELTGPALSRILPSPQRCLIVGTGDGAKDMRVARLNSAVGSLGAVAVVAGLLVGNAALAAPPFVTEPASPATSSVPATVPPRQPSETTATPAPSTGQPTAAGGPLMVRPHASEPTTTMLFWSGPVIATMPALIRAAYLEARDRTQRFVLVLNSGGGSVLAGEQTIAVLREIRATHRLDTEVRNGRICGSMCVFIYLQGQSRTAAPASAWLFHEITRAVPGGGKPPVIDRAALERLIGTYYPPAGVSAAWTEAMKPHTINSDYWLTGRELVEARSGVATDLMSNTQARTFIPGGSDAP
jgi:ATP-dependent protease ClpP protease subunit